MSAVFGLDDVSLVTCPLPVIDNGQVIDNSNENLKVGNALSVKCGTGYTLSSTTQSICQADGSYLPAVPSCDAQNCPAPAISQGTVSPDPILPGGKGTIKCDDGFSLNNNVELTCITLDIFTPSTLPECIAGYCKKVDVLNGVITGPTPYISPGSKLMIQCKEGYVKQDDVVISCITDVQYTPADGVNNVCKAEPCPSVDIKNGQATTGPIQPGDVMRITCDTNYKISSNATITCLSTTLFSPATLPTCQAQNCPARTIAHGQSPEVKPGQQYAVVCDDDYKLSDLTTFTCISLNLYSPATSPTLPTCQAKDCIRPTIYNGEVTGPHIVTPGETLTITCGPEYRLNGDAVVTCEAGSKWNKEIPTCEAVPCPAPTIDLATVTGPTIAPNATVQITCNDPYDLNYNNDLVCISNNTFEPSVLPQCVRVNCNKLDIQNGQVTGPKVITPDSVLLIQCDASYKIEHERAVRCISKNQYNDTLPLCKAQPCPKPGAEYVLNGEITGTGPITAGNWFTIACNVNYKLVGESRLVCKSGNLFDSDFPTCEALPCSKPTISHGFVSNTGSTIAVGVDVKIGCDPLYQLNSTETVTCVAGDHFKPYLPICKGFPCKTSDGLPSISNGQYTNTETAVDSKIEVTCNDGYDLVPGTAVCVTKSRYDGTIPTCKPQNCTVPDIANGYVKKPSGIAPGELIEVLCYRGFKRSTPSTVSCVLHSLFPSEAVLSRIIEIVCL